MEQEKNSVEYSRFVEILDLDKLTNAVNKVLKEKFKNRLEFDDTFENFFKYYNKENSKTAVIDFKLDTFIQIFVEQKNWIGDEDKTYYQMANNLLYMACKEIDENSIIIYPKNNKFSILVSEEINSKTLSFEKVILIKIPFIQKIENNN